MKIDNLPKMFDYQKRCLDRIMQNDQNKENSILKLPTGTGKTRINVEYIEKSLKNGKRIIVVAPSRFVLGNVWINELKKWGVERGKFVQMDGGIPLDLRKSWWKKIQQNNLSVLMTPISLSNDEARGWLDINYFDLLVMDEGHHGVANDMYGWRINHNYSFLNGCKSPIVANTINTDCSRLRALKKNLNAKEITDKDAKTQPVKTIANKIEQESTIILDDEIGKRIRKLANPIEELTGIGFNETTQFFLISKNIDEIAKKKKLSEENKRFILSCWGKIADLNVLRVCLQEDMLEDLKFRLSYFISKAKQSKYKEFLLHLYDLAENCRPVKTESIIKKAIELANQNKLILITTKRRLKAGEIAEELNNKGIKAGTLMGGLEFPQLVLEGYLKNKFQVIVMTPVGIESLNLKEFSALIHVSPYSSKFTKKQIRGRIRGGEEYYFVYKGTNDEKKLNNTEEEPEFGYLYHHYDELNNKIYSYIVLEKDSEGFRIKTIVNDDKEAEKLKGENTLIIPSRYIIKNAEDLSFNKGYIGKFGEEVAKAHLSHNGFKSIKIKDYLNTDLPKEEKFFLRSLCYSAIDFLFLKEGIKYFIEVKTTSKNNSIGLSSWQKEVFKRATKFGYRTMKLNIFINEDKIKIEQKYYSEDEKWEK